MERITNEVTTKLQDVVQLEKEVKEKEGKILAEADKIFASQITEQQKFEMLILLTEEKLKRQREHQQQLLKQHQHNKQEQEQHASSAVAATKE